jgi:4-aminobutyrate--pyruvate transaminase
VLQRHDILLIADEVICGFGRTGNLFGCQTYDIRPDVLVVSKQITSSYMPLSAILVNERFYEPIADESHRIGVLGHGYTASGHPVATAVALETLKIMEERNVVGNAQRRSPRFLAGLAELAKHKTAASCRGVGLIGALELKPWAMKSGKVAETASALALEEGVISRNIGEALCFCPPLIISDDEIDAMFKGVGRALDRLASTLQAD